MIKLIDYDNNIILKWDYSKLAKLYFSRLRNYY